MNEIYFEVKGEALLEKIGMPKAEFARRMGIQRQNVKALFRSKDLRVIRKAAEVMGVPWEMLVGFAEEPDILDDSSRDDSFEIAPEDIPTGGSVDDRRVRQKLSLSSINIGKSIILSIESIMMTFRIIYT